MRELEIVVDASEGFIPLWAADTTLRWRFQKRSLRRFVQPEAVQREVRQLFGESLLAWGSAAPVRFKEDNDLWDFEIVFRRSDECDDSGCVLASAFFPDGGRHQLVMYPLLFEQSRVEQVSTLIHEIGHIFGLRHFFADISEQDWPVEIFGKHSKFSIMNYGDESVLTAADRSDLKRLYNAARRGLLTHINGTPIRLVKPYSSLVHAPAQDQLKTEMGFMVPPTLSRQSMAPSPEPEESTSNEQHRAARYQHQFVMSKPSMVMTEAMDGAGVIFTEGDIKEKQERLKEGLYRIIEMHLDNDTDLKEIADKIVRESEDPLRAVANSDDNYLERHPRESSLLEVIVRTDGSRPSFMVRDGAVDFTTSPEGSWSDILLPQEKLINRAIECVGRIDLGPAHVGTGFLVQENLILTNRHVLQAIARFHGNKWAMMEGATIDFGYEFRARESVRRRALSRVIFSGPDFIDSYNLNHHKLDLALIELTPAADDGRPIDFLTINVSQEWATPGRSGYVYTIGYPGKPRHEHQAIYGTSLLEQLFKSTYGYKRFAPGETLLPGEAAGVPWTAAHDATTLGGNSGSVVLVSGREHAAAALHYGGRLKAPRENWAHILGRTLGATDATSGKTLKQCLDECGIGQEDTI